MSTIPKSVSGSRAKGKQGAGAPAKGAGGKMVRKMNSLNTKYGDDATRVVNQAGADTGASAFPTRLYNRDVADDYEQIKTNLIAGSVNSATPFGMATLQDSDIKWLKSKRDAMQRADFEVWLSQMFDMSNPSHVQILERVYPEYFSRRLAKLEEDAELQLRLAKSKLLKLYFVN